MVQCQAYIIVFLFSKSVKGFVHPPAVAGGWLQNLDLERSEGYKDFVQNRFMVFSCSLLPLPREESEERAESAGRC